MGGNTMVRKLLIHEKMKEEKKGLFLIIDCMRSKFN